MPDSLAAEVMRLRRELAQVKKGSRIAHGASIEDSAVEVRDASGTLRGIVGQQPDGTTAVNIVNGPPPPAPTPPILASVLGGVAASWDGRFTDAAVAPLDWQRVEVHSSTTDGFAPDITTLRATIETAQGGTVIVTCDTPVYVRLLARTTSGTAGAPSGQAGPLGPAPVVADDVLDGIVTTVKLADDAVTQAKVAAAAIGTTEISNNAVTTPKIVAGAVQTAQIDAGAVNTDKLAAGAVTTAKLDALAVTADKIAANAITAGKILAGAVNAAAIAADAIDGKTITGAVFRAVRGDGSVAARMAPDLGDGAAGFETTSPDGTTYSRLEYGALTFGAEGVDQLLPTGIKATAVGGTMDIQSGCLEGGAQAHIIMASGDSPLADGDGSPMIVLEWDGSAGPGAPDMPVYISGILQARSMAFGKIAITPVANTPTSMTVSGLSVAGNTFTAFATPQTTVPGTVVTGCGVTGVSATSLIVWVTRTNTTSTTVNWQILGEK
jgi:hypothetical protein